MSRILVVEDHAIAREPLARLLRYEGFEVRCAANGSDALTALESFQADLVLLDMLMPKMDGVSFLMSVRSHASYRDLPIIALTGLPEGSQLTRARELNVVAVMPKARFTVEELLETIARCLSQSASGRARQVATVV